MAKVSSRTVVNRRAITAIREGIVAGMEDIGQRVLALGEGRVPDATPIGEGLVASGDYGVWSDGRKVAGGATKPRGAKTGKGSVVLVCGYGFPGRFLALGTVHISPDPSWFVTPMNTTIPGAADFIKPEVRKALARVQ